jgi:hypothetical protein
MKALNSICRYCNLPIENLAVLEIDHVIPESLTPEELSPLLARLGNPHLDINSYFNWFPIHNMCNRYKSDDVLPDEALHVLLARAAKKVPDVLAEEERFDRQLKMYLPSPRRLRKIMGRLYPSVLPCGFSISINFLNACLTGGN